VVSCLKEASWFGLIDAVGPNAQHTIQLIAECSRLNNTVI
jgi:hypothetical protein